ncbi:MAG: hypothetical protein QOE30_3318 [Mycobacterium sp.]|nr:hypothetical protein [Mycobacterium sp.]
MSDVHNLPPTQLVDESGPPLLLGEVQRELAAMTFSRYQHSTSVDESTGTYKYDCSGLVDYALGRVLPDALAASPHRRRARRRVHSPATSSVIWVTDSRCRSRSGKPCLGSTNCARVISSPGSQQKPRRVTPDT